MLLQNYPQKVTGLEALKLLLLDFNVIFNNIHVLFIRLHFFELILCLLSKDGSGTSRFSSGPLFAGAVVAVKGSKGVGRVANCVVEY